jgi:CTP:molybdopterin cytidylyltransferase MocA
VTRVVAIILQAVPGAGAGPLESAFAAARAENGSRQARGFVAVGAEARIMETWARGVPFGARLRAAAAANPAAGIVIMGSGSIPLATAADRRDFVAAARTPGGGALANNRYSADIVALPPGTDLRTLPDVAADNGLPRWLAEQRIPVRDLRRRWRLQLDLDSPLDLLLSGHPAAGSGESRLSAEFASAREVAGRIAAVSQDPGAELLVAGRTSSAALRWVEERTQSRTRALVEERGMRTARPGQRPARSSLGLLLDRDGPAALGPLLAELADAAVVDSRVLLAHRLGADEARWPAAEDRFASDLLLYERIEDPWLRELTRSAAEGAIPVLLGGHTLTGPGLRLLLARRP